MSETTSDCIVFLAYANDKVACQALELMRRHTPHCYPLDPGAPATNGAILLFGSNGTFASKYLAVMEHQFPSRLIKPPKGSESAGRRIAIRLPQPSGLYPKACLLGLEQALVTACLPKPAARKVPPHVAEAKKMAGVKATRVRRLENGTYMRR